MEMVHFDEHLAGRPIQFFEPGERDRLAVHVSHEYIVIRFGTLKGI